ncbi:MAG: DUF3634 family protein [Pseudomonadota bacterium]|nr:DUF3634 family protein [Pseudomonadota bacterium]
MVYAVLAILLVLGGLWLLGRLGFGPFERDPIFEIDFEQGRLRGLAGSIPERLRRELVDVAAGGEVSGTVQYFAPGEYGFSPEIPEGIQQRFRNVLTQTDSPPSGSPPDGRPRARSG